MEGAVEGGIDDWGEVVTRYPYGNVGMDHLLSKEQKLKSKKIPDKSILFSFECYTLKKIRTLKTKYNETIERKV